MGGLELTKLTYTKLEDNLIRHRGDRYIGATVHISNFYLYFSKMGDPLYFSFFLFRGRAAGS